MNSLYWIRLIINNKHCNNVYIITKQVNNITMETVIRKQLFRDYSNIQKIQECMYLDYIVSKCIYSIPPLNISLLAGIQNTTRLRLPKTGRLVTAHSDYEHNSYCVHANHRRFNALTKCEERDSLNIKKGRNPLNDQALYQHLKLYKS